MSPAEGTGFGAGTSGPHVPCLKGAGADVQRIMGNGHMETPSVDRQTDRDTRLKTSPSRSSVGER